MSALPWNLNSVKLSMLQYAMRKIKIQDQWPMTSNYFSYNTLRTANTYQGEIGSHVQLYMHLPHHQGHTLLDFIAHTQHIDQLIYQIFSNCHNAIMSIQDRLYHHQQISSWVGIFKQCLHTPNQTNPHTTISLPLDLQFEARLSHHQQGSVVARATARNWWLFPTSTSPPTRNQHCGHFLRFWK